MIEWRSFGAVSGVVRISVVFCTSVGLSGGLLSMWRKFVFSVHDTFGDSNFIGVSGW